MIELKGDRANGDNPTDEARYEVARFASREAAKPISIVQVFAEIDGYHVRASDGGDSGPACPSLRVVLEDHPELLRVAASETTVIRSSELTDWEIGDRLVVGDIDKLDTIPELDSTGMPTGNGWPLDLLCRINDVEWWYFQPTGKVAGFFVPDDFGERDDVEEVAHFYWTPNPEVGDCGDRLERLGNLYRYWNTMAVDYNGDGNDELYRTDATPEDEARKWLQDFDTETLTVNETDYVRVDGVWKLEAAGAPTTDSADHINTSTS